MDVIGQGPEPERDVIGLGREPERGPRAPLPQYWRMAGWAMAGLAVGLAAIGLSREHGAGAPGSARPHATAPATWAVAQGGIAGATVAGVQAPVMALSVSAGGPGMICSPSTGACSIRVQVQVVAPAEGAASGTTRLGLRAPSLWEGL
jgi:hypothetical protein